MADDQNAQPTSDPNLDFSTAVPIHEPSGLEAIENYLKTGKHLGIFDTPEYAAAHAQRARQLQSAVSYAATQNPDAYAKLLQLKQKTGLSPNVIHLQQEQVQQGVDVNSLDYDQMAASHPRTTAWASNPDNAAVSGVDEVKRLANMETSAGRIRALTPAFQSTLNAASAAHGSMFEEEHLGKAIGWIYDNVVVPAATVIDDVAVRPFNAMAQAGAEMGRGGMGVPIADRNTGLPMPDERSEAEKGIARGIGSAMGSTVADPRNWPFFFAPAKGMASRLISAGFAVQQGHGVVQQAQQLGSIIDNPDVPTADKYELGTGIVLGTTMAGFAGGGMAAREVPPAGMGFFDDMAHLVMSAEQSKLKARSPEKFQEAMQHLFAGEQSIQIPAERFDTYFQSKNLNPAQAAQDLGVKNYAEAKLSGGNVEVAPADFLGKLESEHQKGLFADIVHPATGMTLNQQSEGEAELQKWVDGGGPERLSATAAQADAETQASDEYQAVKTKLQQQYIDAGETPNIAENYATLQANVYANLARETGMKPTELMELYRPVMRTGEAPDTGLNQAAESGTPRGWFRALPDGSFEIGKTNIGDLSTFIHEPAHSYLEIIRDLAVDKNASEGLKSDYGKILDFLGAKEGETLTTEQHEKWARANEQYLREGKAPSSSLRGVFQRFAVWLSSIYKRASDLGVELSDDIRGVMDRMYAAEEGVNRAEKESGPQLFSTPEEAGWTPEQFQFYADSKGMEVEQAKSEILSKLNEAAVRERTDSWREEENNTREAVTAEIDKRPEYQAIRTLRDGKLPDGTELKLSRDDLVKQFGEERVKELQKQHPGLYRNEGGIDPDAAAEILGFDSADKMMKVLQDTPRRSAAIEQATREYMTAKHGDIRYDGTLDDQARVALENDKRAANLHKELTALQRKLTEAKEKAADKKAAMRSIEVAPIQAYRDAAQQMVESKRVGDIQPNRYLEANRKYSREAFDALRKGDTEEAALAKHIELMNHFLFREATKAKEYVGKFENYVKRSQTVGVQQKIGKAGGDYLEQFNNLLARYGLRKGGARPETTLAEWAQEQFAAGKESAIAPSLFNEGRTLNYKDTTIPEIRAVHDALVNIRHLASQELAMDVNGRKIEFAASIKAMNDRARESMNANPQRILKRNATITEKATDLAQRGDALLMRTERLVEWLDGGKDGPWHDALWNTAADSQGREYALQEEVTKHLGDLLEQMPKEQRDRMMEKVTIPGVNEPVTRHDLISWALNMGNEGNMDRLTRTFVEHGWDTGAIEAAKGQLTRDEWHFVQGIWDMLKPLGERAFEMEKRLTGLPPIKVEPTLVTATLADGSSVTMAGGYYPILMDPRFSARGATADAGESAQNLMEAGYGRATTSRGYTKARNGYGGPLLLDYEQVLTQHTAKVIKDITHREFILAASKILLDQSVRNTMRETLGPAYEEKMMPWLRTIINDRNGSAAQGLTDFSRLVRATRSNLTVATLSFKISTSLLQWTHAPRMLLYASPKAYSQAIIDFIAHPVEMTREIMELSPNEMRFRGENLDRDIREKINSTTGEKSIGKTVARIGNLSIQYTDHVLSYPLWLSVYREALKEHVDLPESEAKYKAMHQADSAVRLGLGSAAPKDLPPIMRNNDLSKLLTMFYSFHNGIYNQIRDVGHEFKNSDASLGGRSAKLTYGMALSVLVPAVLSQLVLGKKPKDGENPGLWAAKRSLYFGADTIPVLRDAASAMDSDGDVKFTPLMNVLSKGTKATMRAMDDKEEKDWSGIGLDYLETGMDLGGVPGAAQAMKPIRYYKAAHEGKVADPNAFDAFVGSAHK